MRFDTRWLLVAAAGLALFLAVGADLAFHGKLAQWDPAVGAWAREGSGPTYAAAGALATAGSAYVVVPVVAAMAGFLLWRGRRVDALLVVLAAASEEIVAQTVKLLVARPRPPDGAYAASGYSFPSGHASAAAMLATLAVWYAATSLRVRWHVIAILAAGAAWALAMAWSRLALGVHYLTDVVAGLGLGLGVSALVLGLRRDTPGSPEPRTARR